MCCSREKRVGGSWVVAKPDLGVGLHLGSPGRISRAVAATVAVVVTGAVRVAGGSAGCWFEAVAADSIFGWGQDSNSAEYLEPQTC